MSERCIVRIKFTPAGPGTETRRAVSGFLRYVQHRDFHPDSKLPRSTPEVRGLLKYVAYRDRANARAELFGPNGRVGTSERKEFAEFVARSIEGSDPQLFHTRDGRLMDRRRAVSRLIISPEHAQGLDLEALTRAAVAGLESEMGVSNLRWIAAIHRNTRHHHVHLVVAGMREDSTGGYARAAVSKPRLAAMKEAVAMEIERQRREHTPSLRPAVASDASGRKLSSSPALKLPVAETALIRTLPLATLARFRVATGSTRIEGSQHPNGISSLLALRAVARRYARQMRRESEEEARRLAWERAA